MKKIIYILFIIIIPFIFSGCIEEKEVVGPVRATGPITELDMDNKTTLNGGYQILKFEAENQADNQLGTLDIMALQGILNMEYNDENDQLDVTYALEYAGYNATDENLDKQTEIQTTIDMSNISILNESIKYYMKFVDPLELTINDETYKISRVRKLIDDPLDIASFGLDDLSSVIYLCDPIVDYGTERNCAHVNGAIKYIGYYRIEEITCNDITYTGSNGDLAGEMIAHASVGSIVEVPIAIKFQVSNETLATCLFGNNKPENNLYYDNTTYEVHSIADGLSSVFADLGLNGIIDEDADEITRITTLDYEPKTQTVTEEEILYDDKDFGSGNPVSLKLKIQHQWSMGNTEVVRNVLDNKPYIEIPSGEEENN